MLCKVCGRTAMNEKANFCDYCGASFRDGEGFVSSDFTYEGAQRNIGGDTVGTVQAESTIFGNSYADTLKPNEANSNNKTSEKPMSFMNWMLVLILPYLAPVGTFVYLGILFVWGFGRNSTPTKKNWARATLVIFLVVFILVYVLIGDSANFLSMFWQG